MKFEFLLLNLLLLASCTNNDTKTQKSPSFLVFDNIDSLVTEICDDIKRDSTILDSTLFREHFNSHVKEVLRNQSIGSQDCLMNVVFYRLQIKCQPYWDFINKISPKNKYWIEHKVKPVPKISSIDCKPIKDYKSLKYFEYDGPIVEISIENDTWIEQYQDKTYSKLKINWLNECQFQLTFIESNNLARQSVSKPGTTYNYNVIEKGVGYYTVVLEMPDSVFLEFKLFY